MNCDSSCDVNRRTDSPTDRGAICAYIADNRRPCAVGGRNRNRAIEQSPLTILTLFSFLFSTLIARALGTYSYVLLMLIQSVISDLCSPMTLIETTRD